MSLAPGTRLGHYDVTSLLGEGGMGQVWQATDTQLNRQVALKILPDAFAADPDRLARFKREAQILASLNHPNIAAIYGIEEAEGTRALVLELVEGPTLADRIAKGPIPLDEALPIARQIAEALEAAHEAGVIHRDLKPANITVREDGTVKVLDFGLAKAFQPDASDPNMSLSPTISLTAAATQMGMVIGTAAYMAPEQAKGKPVDKRADVWAFGAVVYEMLTGKRAFVGDDVSDTLAAVLRAEVNLDGLPDETPPRLRQVLRACLQRDPKQRVQAVGDVRLAMEGAFETIAPAGEATVAPGTAQPTWRRLLPSVAAAVVVGLGVGLAVWSVARPEPPVVARFEHELPDDQRFGSTGRPITALSPDGRAFVYNTPDGLYLRAIGELDARLIPGTASSLTSPVFSPDGQTVGYWDRTTRELKRIAISGGAPVTITAAPDNPYGVRWESDGTILYGQEDGIWHVPDTGGTPEFLITAEEGERLHGPQMLPGGEWVLFTFRPAGTGAWDEAQIVVESLTTRERETLITGGRDARYVPTGHLVYGLNGVILAVPFDVGNRQVVGGPVSLIEGVGAGADGNSGAMHFALANNGSLVYVPGSAGGSDVVSLVWVGRDGDEERLPAPPRAYDRPRVSPDGTRVAVDIADGDNTDVWIWDLARETPTQLTFDEGVDDFPLWTPDGARVVFQSSREGGGLFWKAADGTGQVERLKDGAARPYAWAADGRLIFEQAGDIGVLTMEGERTVEMLLDAEFSETEPALSPDGRWLAYQSRETGTPLIYVQPFPNIDDGQWNVSLGLGLNPVWSPDGRELFYLSLTDLMVAQTETEPTFSHRTPEPLFRRLQGMLGGSGVGRRFDIAPVGDRFIVPKRGTAEQTSDDEPFNGLVLVLNWFEELKARVPVP